MSTQHERDVESWVKNGEESCRKSIDCAISDHEKSEFIDAFNRMKEHLCLRMRKQGFWDEPNFASKIALCHSELSEALEAFRDHDRIDDKIPQFKGTEAELADVIIRILDLAGFYNLDVAEAMFEKIKFNESRPFRHGKTC